MKKREKQLEIENNELRSIINNQQNRIQELENIIISVENSRSWKLTKFARFIGEKYRLNRISILNNLYPFKKSISLAKENPVLIKKALFLLKTQGLSYTLTKIRNKIEKLDFLSSSQSQDEKNINLSELLSFIDCKNQDLILNFYKENKLDKPIDIIIPVYNGYEFLPKLFDSIIKNTTLPYRLLIGNDKSPDSRVKEFIENFIENNQSLNIKFIDNKENLGFLKTVNTLTQYAENHLVILNTDTEVPRYWLERLMYPILSKKNIASTTPFTNSGTICSFPDYLVDNSGLYKDLSLKQIDSLFGYIDVESTMIDVPTGVGFCMGMNFNVIQQIGMFDEIYGKGYGEENDWCQRAIQAGYKNVHITNLFVYHKHGGSFLSEDKKRYIEEHYQILLNKFPTYDNQIQTTIKENRLLPIRKLMKVMIDFEYTTQCNILFIDHNLGGGANLYRHRKIESLVQDNNGVICFLYNINKNEYTVEFITKDYKETFAIDDKDDIYKVLSAFKIDDLFVNGLVSFPNVVSMLNEISLLVKDKRFSKVTFPIHDYFCISPNYTLLGENNIYEGVPLDDKTHSEFLKESKGEFKLFCDETNATIWRKAWNHFLDGCSEILCFSHSSEDIILSIYPELDNKLVYIPHSSDDKFDNIYDEKTSNSKKVIGILGNINLPKGREVIHNLVEYIDENNLDIDVVLIGNIDVDISSQHFIRTGSYSRKDVPRLIKKYGITEFLIPSVWPETFSYTTDEIMQLGYPLSVFDLGAPAERVSSYNKGQILPLTGYLEILCQQ